MRRRRTEGFPPTEKLSVARLTGAETA